MIRLWIYICKLLAGTPKKEESKKQDDGLLHCPKCDSVDWLEGPGGGSFGNIECAHCHTNYNNLGPFGLQPIGN